MRSRGANATQPNPARRPRRPPLPAGRSSRAVQARGEVAIASISLVVGALATPVLYIVAAVLFPEGFAQLRDASAQTFLYHFAATLAPSTLFTVLIGGATWKPLHAYSWDGFLSYALLGAFIAGPIGLILDTDTPNFAAIALAACNGLAVRATERVIRATRSS